jgi:hypothetical protein
LKSAWTICWQEFANETVPSCSGASRSTMGGSLGRVAVQNALLGRCDWFASATVATAANTSGFKRMVPHLQAILPDHRSRCSRNAHPSIHVIRRPGSANGPITLSEYTASCRSIGGRHNEFTPVPFAACGAWQPSGGQFGAVAGRSWLSAARRECRVYGYEVPTGPQGDPTSCRETAAHMRCYLRRLQSKKTGKPGPPTAA